MDHDKDEAVANLEREKDFGDDEPDDRKPGNAGFDGNDANEITGSGANHVPDRVLDAVAFVVAW